MLQEDRGRRASGNITFMEFEQLFDREQIRTFFQAGRLHWSLWVMSMSRSDAQKQVSNDDHIW